MITTRFAPSPTGHLHIGGLRTALYSYLHARAKNGKFLLRIEDTDTERNSKEALDGILEAFKWVGLEYDSPMLFQSERTPIYQQYAQKLLESLPHKNFTYYSLQYEGIDSGLAKDFGVIDMSKEIKDFYDSARILLNMDFVISIDSALAHLSATLGIPTAVLLYKRHDWRWGRFCKHDSSVWYDNTKLFIQEDLHEWRSVLENLHVFLEQTFKG